VLALESDIKQTRLAVFTFSGSTSWRPEQLA